MHSDEKFSAEALPPGQFAMAVSIAISGGALRRSIDPAIDPAKDPVQSFGENFVDDDECDVIYFASGPTNEAMRSVKTFLKDDEGRFISFMFRFFALMEILQAPQFEEWTKRDSGGEITDIHHAVLNIAAEMPLSKSLRFPERKFTRRLTESRGARPVDWDH